MFSLLLKELISDLYLFYFILSIAFDILFHVLTVIVFSSCINCSAFTLSNEILRFLSGIEIDIITGEDTIFNFTVCENKSDFYEFSAKRFTKKSDALKEWKVSIFKIVDQRIKFYSQNTNLLPPKPKSTFRHLKQGIQDFHRKYVLVPADKAANNVVVV